MIKNDRKIKFQIKTLRSEKCAEGIELNVYNI